jgi:hypothetical protein
MVQSLKFCKGFNITIKLLKMGASQGFMSSYSFEKGSWRSVSTSYTTTPT